MNPRLLQIGEAIHDGLKEYIKQYSNFGPDLTGACAVGSYFLATEATKEGIPCQMCLRSYHSFCMSEGIIYDPTCTQIRSKDGYLPHKVGVFTPQDLQDLSITGWYAATSYRLKDGGLNTTEESADWANKDWPYYQQPRRYTLHWQGSKALILLIQG